MSCWLHCNSCYKVPCDRCTFYITSCGHTYCDKCDHRGWREKCLLCGTSNPNAIPLADPIPNHVRTFVSDLAGVLKMNPNPWAKQILATWEWQETHRKRLFHHLRNKISSNESYIANLKKELVKYLDQKEKERQTNVEELRNAAIARLQKQKEEYQGYFDALEKEAQKRLEHQRQEFQEYARDFQHKLEQQKSDFQDKLKTLEREIVKLRDENTYLKRLLGQKSSPARMSPSGDRGRPSFSPTMKGFPGSSPTSLRHASVRSHQERHHAPHRHDGIHKSPHSSMLLHKVSPDTTTANRMVPSPAGSTKISLGLNMISGRAVSKTPPSGHAGGSLQTPSTVLDGIPGIDERLQNFQKIARDSRSVLSQSSQKSFSRSPNSAITTGRVSMRTPPSGGKLGYIPQVSMPTLFTPSTHMYAPKTPKSMPHPMNF